VYSRDRYRVTDEAEENIQAHLFGVHNLVKSGLYSIDINYNERFYRAQAGELLNFQKF
jgi:hypothetical protein